MRTNRLIYDNQNLKGHDFSGMNLSGASFKSSNLEGSDFSEADLTGAVFDGAYLYCVCFEGAVLKDVHVNQQTRYFEMKCPREGAFLGYKKCFNFRIVQLLIPADARRLSATSNACRCDKAKVLSIKSVDLTASYDKAYSYFDESFLYRVGDMVYADGFCEDRWKDSSQGIHFYLTRKEALSYL